MQLGRKYYIAEGSQDLIGSDSSSILSFVGEAKLFINYYVQLNGTVYNSVYELGNE